MVFAIPYTAALLVLVTLDALWLGVLMRGYIARELGHVLGEGVVWPAVILFYILYAAAAVFFCAVPARSIAHAAMLGALLGFTAYMTYDLVNLATLRDWPIQLTVIDIAWGTFITALAAAAARAVLA